MAEAIDVTPTAVRQRLVRLLAQDLVRREAERCGRGRPRHRYRLTEKGLRLTGSNFTDLALALWSQLKTIQDDEIRSELVGRVVKALAEGYAKEIRGTTTGERMRSLAGLLSGGESRSRWKGLRWSRCLPPTPAPTRTWPRPIAAFVSWNRCCFPNCWERTCS